VFERPIVIGQRLRWRYVGSNKPSEDAVVVNVRTDREESAIWHSPNPESSFGKVAGTLPFKLNGE
jgi:hypothetical protein